MIIKTFDQGWGRQYPLKQYEQVIVTDLVRHFDEDPHWSKETLKAISRQTGLSEGQVYKWGWD